MHPGARSGCPPVPRGINGNRTSNEEPGRAVGENNDGIFVARSNESVGDIDDLRHSTLPRPLGRACGDRTTALLLRSARNWVDPRFGVPYKMRELLEGVKVDRGAIPRHARGGKTLRLPRENLQNCSRRRGLGRQKPGHGEPGRLGLHGYRPLVSQRQLTALPRRWLIHQT